MNTLAFLVLCLAPALQDTTQFDTHRVHLRNGNFLDGILVQVGEKDVLFRWSPGVLMRIKIADIKGQIEEIKIRPLNTEPRKVQIKDVPPAPVSDVDVKPPPRDPKAPASDIGKFFARIMAHPDMTTELLAKESNALGVEGARAMIRELPQMDAQTTDLAFMSLGLMRDFSFDRELRELLESKRSDLRAGATTLLGSRAAPESYRAVQGMLKDPVPAVRLAALMGLPNFNQPSSLDVIVEMAVDPDSQVRLRSIKTAENLSGMAGRDNEVVQRWLSLIGTAPMDALVEIAGGIARLSDRAGEGFPLEDVRSRLTQFLSYREPQARAAAAFALTSVRPPETTAEALLSALEAERDPKVIVTLCDALGKIRIQKAAEPLVERLRDNDKTIKAAAARALEKVTGLTGMGSEYDKWREWLDGRRSQ